MMIVLDQNLTDSILDDRRSKGNKLRDESWEGVTYIMPDPNNQHQDLSWFLSGVFWATFAGMPGHRVQPTPNLSDRIEGWSENYRNPDLAYFSPECDAEDHGTFWCGGPDFLIEIVSPEDMSRDKLPFYASIGTREVLILDRDPWQIELYQLRRGQLKMVMEAKPGSGDKIACATIPLQFELLRGRPRPKLRATHTESGHSWTF